MAIRFKCESCDSPLKVKDELAGRKIRCPECKSSNLVPEELDDAPTEPTRQRSGSTNRAKRNNADSPWYVKHWQWGVVLAVLILSLIPKTGLMIAGLVALVGIVLTLIAGVAPFFRILAGDPGTVLQMIFSRSARFEMMDQPDSHPYKKLVRSAFDPTRGLFWRGVLLIVSFIPAAFINSTITEIFPPQRQNGPPPQFANPGNGPRPQPGAINPPNFPPVLGGPNAGRNAAPRNGIGDDRIMHVKITYATFNGKGPLLDSLKTELASLPGYVADSLQVDEEAKIVRLQHRGPIGPQVIAPILSRVGLGNISVAASTDPSK